MINSVFKNASITSLLSSINTVVTSLTVTDASVFPTITEGQHFTIVASSSPTNFEILKVTAVAGNTLTVTRAQEGTTAKSFDAGTVISNRLTAGQVNEIISEVNSKATEALSSEAIFTSENLELDPDTFGVSSGEAFSLINTSDFDPALDGSVWAYISPNSTWYDTNATIDIFFSMDTSSAGNVKFNTDFWDVTEGSTPVLGTPTNSYVDSIANDVSNTNKVAKLTLTNGLVPAVTVNTALIALRFTRHASDAADTYTGKFQLIKIVVKH